MPQFSPGLCCDETVRLSTFVGCRAAQLVIRVQVGHDRCYQAKLVGLRLGDPVDGSEIPFPTTWDAGFPCKWYDIYHISWWMPYFWLPSTAPLFLTSTEFKLSDLHWGSSNGQGSPWNEPNESRHEANPKKNNQLQILDQGGSNQSYHCKLDFFNQQLGRNKTNNLNTWQLSRLAVESQNTTDSHIWGLRHAIM